LCIDDTVYVHNGVRIAGLGGSLRYRRGAWQFTEAEMRSRIRRLRPRIDRLGGLDVLVTHAPLHGYGDLSDLPHRGFTVFGELLNTYRPPLMLHGHVHLSYGANLVREHRYGSTRIINACGRVTLDLPEPPPTPRRHRMLLPHLW
ncbi:MAG: metallophosphoesterase, partial [Gemmiger sp.]